MHVLTFLDTLYILDSNRSALQKTSPKTFLLPVLELAKVLLHTFMYMLQECFPAGGFNVVADQCMDS